MHQNQQQSDPPFMSDSHHIYNALSDTPELTRLNFGWKVVEIHLAKDLKLDGSIPCDGITDFEGCKITLDIDLEDRDARETLIHEIFHCFLECLGMHEKNFPGGFISTTNEYLADTLAKQMIQFRSLNPGVFETIMSHATQ